MIFAKFVSSGLVPNGETHFNLGLNRSKNSPETTGTNSNNAQICMILPRMLYREMSIPQKNLIVLWLVIFWTSEQFILSGDNVSLNVSNKVFSHILSAQAINVSWTQFLALAVEFRRTFRMSYERKYALIYFIARETHIYPTDILFGRFKSIIHWKTYLTFVTEHSQLLSDWFLMCSEHVWSLK